MGPPYLNLKLLQPGDIVFSLGEGWMSKQIARFGGKGDYSHAAIYIGNSHLFEALDDGVGPTRLYIDREELYQAPRGALPNHQLNKWLATIPDTVRLCVMRHPDMEQALKSRGYSDLNPLTESSVFLQYPHATQLATAIWCNRFAGWLVKAGLQAQALFEKPRVVPGPFCSQLVVQIMDGLGLRLFARELDPAEVSPSRLANSDTLREVPGASTFADPEAKLGSPYSGQRLPHRCLVQIGVQWKVELYRLSATQDELTKRNAELLRKLLGLA
jgi:hypothetical protein